MNFSKSKLFLIKLKKIKKSSWLITGLKWVFNSFVAKIELFILVVTGVLKVKEITNKNFRLNCWGNMYRYTKYYYTKICFKTLLAFTRTDWTREREKWFFLFLPGGNKWDRIHLLNFSSSCFCSRVVVYHYDVYVKYILIHWYHPYMKISKTMLKDLLDVHINFVLTKKI